MSPGSNSLTPSSIIIITPPALSDPRHSAWEIVLVTFQNDLSIPAGALAAQDRTKNTKYWRAIWYGTKLAVSNDHDCSCL